MSIVRGSLREKAFRSVSNFLEVEDLFEVTDTMPPVSSPMLILEDGESPLILSGHKRNKDTIKGLYNVILPLVKKGKCRLIIFWQGNYRTDVFELKPNKVDEYLTYLKEYARREWTESPI